MFTCAVLKCSILVIMELIMFEPQLNIYLDRPPDGALNTRVLPVFQHRQLLQLPFKSCSEESPASSLLGTSTLNDYSRETRTY